MIPEDLKTSFEKIVFGASDRGGDVRVCRCSRLGLGSRPRVQCRSRPREGAGTGRAGRLSARRYGTPGSMGARLEPLLGALLRVSVPRVRIRTSAPT